MSPKIATRRVSLLLLLFTLCAVTALGQTTSFTYQGRLSDGGTPATGNYDLQFALFDSVSAGTQIGSTNTISTVGVSAGIFTVQLDFGANAFPGASRFLEIGARLSGGGAFTILSPRQPITSTPYAIRSANASSADAVTVAGVPSGSANYVQNQTASTQAAGFNISGNGSFGGNVGIGTTTPGAKLTVRTGTNNYGFTHTDGTITVGSFVGLNGGWYGTNSNHPLFFFTNNSPPKMTLTPLGDVGIGTTTPGAKLDVEAVGVGDAVSAQSSSGDGVIGFSDSGDGVLGFSSSGDGVVGNTQSGVAVKGFGTSWFTNDTTPSLTSSVTGDGAGVAIGSVPIPGYGYVFAFDYKPPGAPKILALNHFGGFVGIGTNAPTQTLDVAGRARVRSIPLAAATGTVCFNAVGDLLQCGASSLRWKTNVHPFTGGLDIVRRLRPINFNWKESGLADIGLGAEDVSKVAPSLTFVNNKGEAEGVRYERLNVVLINAIKEQQDQIEQQQKLIKQQEARLTGQQQQLTILKRLVCVNQRRARACKKGD